MIINIFCKFLIKYYTANVYLFTFLYMKPAKKPEMPKKPMKLPTYKFPATKCTPSKPTPKKK